jgi:hypothetical protein
VTAFLALTLLVAAIVALARDTHRPHRPRLLDGDRVWPPRRGGGEP